MNQQFLLLFIILSLGGCIGQENDLRTKRFAGIDTNYHLTVDENHGRILSDNPIILSEDPELKPDIDLNTLLGSDQYFITDNQFLIASCGPNDVSVEECFEVKKDVDAKLLAKNRGTWAWDANGEEFLQVNTFWHIQKIIEEFHKRLEFSFKKAYSVSGSSPNYTSALPLRLFNSPTQSFWLHANNQKLVAYASCDQGDNAFYGPADNTLCLGYDTQYDQVKFAQDPTVIYHEMGHALTHLMLNMRNFMDTSIKTETDLGYLFFDEAGSIGEGLADYFSFMMTERPHFGEWALGRFLGASRALSEEDPLHDRRFSTAPDRRFSYPGYLLYNPNQPELKVEDTHYAGQIISHYLTALTNDFKSYCQMNTYDAVSSVLHILFETFAELGGQTGYISDLDNISRNLNRDHAIEWVSMSNPINYRSFVQTMAKYIHDIYSNPSLNNCNKGVFPKNQIERLLDDYGLLLFKNYNNNGNGNQSGYSGPSVLVDPQNRKRSLLIPKNLLKLDPRENATQAYIFDNPKDMLQVIQNMQSSGQIGTLSPLIESGLPYNNGNGRISPGEFVGLSLALYNNSNSFMGGVQLLGNDWDHAKNGMPCSTFSDAWPLEVEGAVDSSHEAGTNPGECHHITRSNGGEPEETLAPICWVQIVDDISSRWIGQKEFMEEIELDPSLCLSGSEHPNDCFVRSVKGANHAFFSTIGPKSTFVETLRNTDDNGLIFNSNNIIFFEINPWIPPGTTFQCRFRARFSNCDDCWTDPQNVNDDYLDYEYSGGKPFTIIHFKFNVID